MVCLPVRRHDVQDRAGIPVYASDGVENNAIADGTVVYRAKIQKPGSHVVDHLNPQTMGE